MKQQQGYIPHSKLTPFHYFGQKYVFVSKRHLKRTANKVAWTELKKENTLFSHCFGVLFIQDSHGLGEISEHSRIRQVQLL